MKLSSLLANDDGPGDPNARAPADAEVPMLRSRLRVYFISHLAPPASSSFMASLDLALGLALEDGEGKVGDGILRLLEAEGGETADNLDDRDALGGVDVGDDEVELGLLRSLLSTTGGGAGGHDNAARGGGGVDAEGLLDLLDELGGLEELWMEWNRGRRVTRLRNNFQG